MASWPKKEERLNGNPNFQNDKLAYLNKFLIHL